jgi:hypothetical protein
VGDVAKVLLMQDNLTTQAQVRKSTLEERQEKWAIGLDFALSPHIA